MYPVWGSREVLLKPDRVLLWAPNSIRLHAGILDRLVRPPATPGEGIGSEGTRNRENREESKKMRQKEMKRK